MQKLYFFKVFTKYFKIRSVILEICGAITSSTVDIKCTLNEVEQSCLEPLLDGTIATMSCKQWYESLQPLTYNTAICKNGSWTSAIPNCLPGEK